VRVATTDAPAYAIDLGGLAGGRRILSGDLAVLESVASLLARRIDAVRVSRERHERDLREETLHGLSSEAELRALRAQLNPHFLFNALTTLGYLMRAAPDRAQAALYSLTSLLRAVLSRSSAESCTLDEELALIGDYLAIERARFEERLRVELDVPEDLRAARVPPLLLQPLVENAVKHGITPSRHGGKVIVRARRMPGELLRIQVRDTGIGVENGESLDERRRSHVGLSNLEQRLDRTYGTEASLTFSSVPGAGATVTVTLPLRFALEPHRAAS
jgi:LytS/YehU family sensor histidine kinase